MKKLSREQELHGFNNFYIMAELDLFGNEQNEKKERKNI